MRKTSDEERLRTSEALNSIYDDASAEVQAMFNQSAGRFTEIMEGMKVMAGEMQRELETTRTELRRGILELPQETAESTAQMRRVIVDQIEALAELNRIVARHGRSLDATEPVRREAEPLFAAGGGRGPARPVRADIAAPPQAPAATRHRPARRRGETVPPNLEPGARRQGRGTLRATAAGCPICSRAPRATTARRLRHPPAASRRAAKNDRSATASNRSIRFRSISRG